jgi:hypothetical protein
MMPKKRGSAHAAVEVADKAVVKKFNDSFVKQIQPAMARVDQRKVEAQAKAPSMPVSNAEIEE